MAPLKLLLRLGDRQIHSKSKRRTPNPREVPARKTDSKASLRTNHRRSTPLRRAGAAVRRARARRPQPVVHGAVVGRSVLRGNRIVGGSNFEKCTGVGRVLVQHVASRSAEPPQAWQRAAAVIQNPRHRLLSLDAYGVSVGGRPAVSLGADPDIREVHGWAGQSAPEALRAEGPLAKRSERWNPRSLQRAAITAFSETARRRPLWRGPGRRMQRWLRW